MGKYLLRRRHVLFLVSLLIGLPTYAIVGGIDGPIPKDHPSSYNTVALVRPNGTTGKYKVFCSGFIYSENIILTAKHCIRDEALGEFSVYFGENTSTVDASLLRTVVDSSYYGPAEYEITFPSYDFAWIKIDGILPNVDGNDPTLPHFRPIPVLTDPNLLKQDDIEIHLAGYGNQATQLMQIIAGEKKHVAMNSANYLDTPQLSSLAVIQGEEGHSNCHGDSGGPSYAKVYDETTGESLWTVFGTTAGFDLALTPESYKKLDDEMFPYVALCGKSQTIYTFVGDYVSWIEDTTGQEAQTIDDIRRPLDPGLFEKSQVKPSNFKDWCNSTYVTDFSTWKTLRQLIVFAMEAGSQKYTEQEIFLNCDIAEGVLKDVPKFVFGEESYFGNLAPLAALGNIKRLQFETTESVPDLSVFQSDQINELSLNGLGLNHINEVPGLAQLTGLKVLNINRNKITSLEGIQNFAELKELNISANKINDIEPLRNLNQLETLNVFQNLITDITPIKNFRRLKTFTGSSNPFDTPKEVFNWPSLTHLYMFDANLRNLNFLQNAGSLQTVNVSGNRLKTLKPLEGKPIKSIRFFGNPLPNSEKSKWRKRQGV